MTREEQLSRTVALFKTEFDIADESVIVSQLTQLKVALVAGDEVMKTRAGQVALLTAAMLMARSGHQVFINVFDAPLVGYQPPFDGRTIYEAISNLRGQLIIGSDISIGFPVQPDVAFDIGGQSSIPPFTARKTISVGWSAWAGEISEWPWKPLTTEHDWPMGAMAAAVLVAAEAVKFAAKLFAPVSGHPSYIRDLFAPSRRAELRLAPEHTPRVSALGAFDIISAGAVSNAAVYALLRLPDVTGRARAFDKDWSEPSNRNRNMLLIGSLEGLLKVELLAHFGRGIGIKPVRRHFQKKDLKSLADTVLVGVDDVPTRWLLAEAKADWMGVGATTDFGAMASVHFPHSACSACLHPHNEDVRGPTPTIAFVSFLAGLLVATDLLVELSRSTASLVSRHRLIFPLRCDGQEGTYSAPVAPRPDCPAGCPASQVLRRRA
jgi:hypothetical protein